jgi:hypothetical protein
MGYTRAPASDFDGWGVDGWESKNLIPLMKKVLERVVRIFVKLKLLSDSWKHTRCSSAVQLTGMMVLSRCPLVGIN